MDEMNIQEQTAGTEQPMQTAPAFSRKHAGFWIRFFAYAADLLIVASLSGILIKPVFRLIGAEITNPSFLFFSPYKITLFVLFFAYFAVMTKFFGQTAGKMIFGIRVVNAKADKPLSWSTVLFREVIGRFPSKLLTILYVIPAFMPKKEALHDLFADTYVVHEDVYERTAFPASHSANAPAR